MSWNPFPHGLPLNAAKSLPQSDDVEALLEQAYSLHRIKSYEEAANTYRAVLARDPANVAALVWCGHALRQMSRFEEASEMFSRALAVDPQDPAAFLGLGSMFRGMGRSEEAISACQQALALRPDYVEALVELGKIHSEMGDVAAAKTAFAGAMTLEPQKVPILYSLAMVGKVQSGDPVFANLKTVLAEEHSLTPVWREQLHFALAKAHDDTGNREQGFRHQLEANALRRKRAGYNESQALENLEQIRRVFTPEVMASSAGAGDPSRLPVFVVGMPRSGSTLIEQILSSHPSVFGSGERRFLPQAIHRVHNSLGVEYPHTAAATPSSLDQLSQLYLDTISGLAPGASRFIDKFLGNYHYIGLIHLALPNARIIHAVRDPVDTCLSCFSSLFSGANLEFTYDLGELGRYHRAHSALMEHWRAVLPPGVMLEVRYESVVQDLETEARRMIAHCGLEWDDACLSFFNTKRGVSTASLTQVRQPIYKSSVGRWRPDDELLRPLISGLAGN